MARTTNRGRNRDSVPTLRRETISEREMQSGAGFTVDREKGVIPGVRILGRESKNGRVYSDAALDKAPSLYEESTVNLDHVFDGEEPRGVLESWGVLRNCRREGDCVRGDLHYLKEHSSTPVLLEKAERFPRSFGLSHAASGDVRPGLDGQPDVVEDLFAVESVDVVGRPATNDGLFESHDSRRTPKMATKPKTRKVADVVRECKAKDAGRLRRLLEDDFATMAGDAPDVVVDDPSTPEDELAASIESLVLAVLRDDSLDNTGKLGKIRAILGVADKLSGEADSGSSTSADDGEGVDGSTMESIRRRLDAAERRDTTRDLLESAGLRLGDLTAKQRDSLAKSNLEALPALVEAFAATATSETRETRPKVNRRFAESTDAEDVSLEEARAAARGKA